MYYITTMSPARAPREMCVQCTILQLCLLLEHQRKCVYNVLYNESRTVRWNNWTTLHALFINKCDRGGSVDRR